MTNKISRRQVAKGVAWSLPVIAVASAAPRAAASEAVVPRIIGVCRDDAHNHGKGKDVHIFVADIPGDVMKADVSFKGSDSGFAERINAGEFIARQVPNGTIKAPVTLTYGGVTLTWESKITDCQARKS